MKTITIPTTTKELKETYTKLKETIKNKAKETHIKSRYNKVIDYLKVKETTEEKIAYTTKDLPSV